MRFIIGVVLFVVVMATVLVLLGGSAGTPEVLITAGISLLIAWFGSKRVMGKGESPR